jgi:2-methylisocitrate lyase-like PEP mutase family enzyme
MRDQAEKGRAFQALHAREELFVMPNPWDVGSAKMLAEMGFEARATTSSGFAHSLGRPDMANAVSREEINAHVRALVAATPLPLSVDLEAGYGATPAEVAETVRMVIDAGAAGCSIEDNSYAAGDPLYPIPEAVRRLAAARKAIDAAGVPFVLTARAECFLVRHPNPLAESIRRLVAFEEAGADCLYAPGLTTRDEIDQVIAAVERPVNVLGGYGAEPMPIADLAAARVRRVSLGGWLANAAMSAAFVAAKEVLEGGTFAFTRTARAAGSLDQMFA